MLLQADYQRARNVTAGAVKRTPIAKLKLNLALKLN
jgi:hypothetical protein